MAAAGGRGSDVSVAAARPRRTAFGTLTKTLKSSRLGRLGRIEWILMAIIVVVPAALIWRYASPSYFVSDDLTNLYNAHASHVGFSYAFGSAIGHLAPAYRLAYQALDRLAPFNFDVALAFLIACHVVSTVLLQRILELVFGRNWWTYALALAWAISIIYLPAFAFFAAGILAIPAITATLASMHGYLCWRTTGRRGWIVWSILAMCIGLAFYTKALLIPLYLLLMRVLLLDPRTRVRAAVESLRDEWQVWLAYVTVCVAYLVVYAIGPYQRVTSGASVGDVLTYLRVLWVDGFWPMVFGVRVPQFGHTHAQDIAIVAAQLALVAVVLWCLDRRPTAWRAWVFLVVGLLVNALMVVGRVAEWGAVPIGYYVRYYTEPALLVPLAIAFAFATPRLRARVAPVKGAARPARDVPGLRLPGRRTAIAAGAVLAAYLAATLATTESFSRPWSDKPFSTQIANGRLARPYFEHLMADLSTAGKAGTEPSLLNVDIPPWILSGFANLSHEQHGVRYTLLSSIVPLFDSRVAFDQPRSIHVVAPDGHLRPTRFVAAATWSAGSRSPTAVLHLTGVRVDRTASERCLTAGGGGGVVALLPRRPLQGRDWWLRGGYRTDSAFPLALQNNAGLGFGNSRPIVPGMPPSRTAIVPLGEVPGGVPTNAGVRILLPPSHHLCLRSLAIGSFQPPGLATKTGPS
jgi:hypothetical protein